VALDGFCQRTREFEANLPIIARQKRNHDVEAFTACGLEKTRKTERFQHASNEARTLGDFLPWNLTARIDIENDPIRLLDVLDPCIPRMDFEHIHLHQRTTAAGLSAIR
jgi:hypothetical protein